MKTLPLIVISALVVGQAGAATLSSCRFGPVAAPPQGAAPSASMTGSIYTVEIVYALPSDVPYDPLVLDRIKRAASNVQAWYQCATGGLTFEFAYTDTVGVYYAQHDHLYYKNNGDWWGSLLPEMGSAGQSVWRPYTILVIWAQGAGWWAGGAQWCSGLCGVALLGVENFPEFNNPDYSGGTCPGGTGVVAFPCIPEGGFAHELGHTLGLVHPSDVPATSADAGHSVMQTHWNFPNYAPPTESPWGFLSQERLELLTNPFLKWNLPIAQIHSGCDVVNLPDLGSAPVAAFTTGSSSLNRFEGTNTSTGATYTYWTFGDSSVSNDVDGIHYYRRDGDYLVTLRSMAGNGMVDTAATIFTASGMTTAANVTLIEAKVLSSGVRLSWRVPASGSTLVASVQRRSEQTGWADLSGPFTLDGSQFTYDDSSPSTGETYGYRLALSDGRERWCSDEAWVRIPNGSGVPQRLSFRMPWPNPSDGEVRFGVGLPAGGHLRLRVFDVAGRNVATLVDNDAPIGWSEPLWDGRDATGHLVPGGVYWARLEYGPRSMTHRFVVAR